LDEIKTRYVEAARQNVIIEEKATRLIKVVVFTLVALLGLTIVLLPLAVWLFRWWRKTRQGSPDPREALAFAERAVPVMAFPLMVNSLLRRPGTDRAPGLFLISFDPRVDAGFMGELAERVGAHDAQTMTRAEYDFCRGLMADEEYRVYRRRELPPGLTKGAVVYAVDLVISPLLLSGRHISDEMPLVPCMAEPSDDGRVMQMPYWIATGGPPPGQAESNEFLRTLDAIPEMTAMAGTTPAVEKQQREPERE
jgi:hypothetical protein